MPRRRVRSPELRPFASLALAVLLATATPALAVCGNGALDSGEPCDTSAPNGSAACPGSCIPPGLIGQCTCAVPSTDARRYVVTAMSQLRLASGTIVGLGHLGATQPGGLIQIGRDSSIPGGTDTVGDQVRVLRGAHVGRLFANAPFVDSQATVTNGGPFPVHIPLVLMPPPSLPPIPGSGPGTPPTVSVPPGATQPLAPGRYAAVTVGTNAKLVLHGLTAGGSAGIYEMQSLLLMPGSHMLADNPVVVFLDDRLAFSGASASGSSFIGPAPSAHLIAGDVVISAVKSARFGNAAVVTAHVSAPTIKVGKNAVFTGRLRGFKVDVGKNAALFLQGACGDGILDPGEQCDTSAPGGDVACPGACIAGDPQALGGIAEGQPGECTCRCNADADCDDGNACNGHETCQNHVCVVGIPPDCNDHNPCTKDCDPAVGCVNTPVPNGTACSDGNPCTASDSCQNGVCAPGTPVADGTACSDGNKCTVVDVCHGGTCVAGPARDCSDDNSCSVDSCDPVAGCVHTLLPDGDACDDKNVCTTIDRCQNGTCIGTGPRNCDDGNPCTTDTCDPVAGCQHTRLPDGTVCATGKTCHAGVCS